MRDGQRAWIAINSARGARGDMEIAMKLKSFLCGAMLGLAAASAAHADTIKPGDPVNLGRSRLL